MPFDEFNVQRKPCYTDAKHLEIPQGVSRTIEFTLHDKDGNAYDLTTLGAADTIHVHFTGKTTVNAPHNSWNIHADIVDAVEGKISFYVDKTEVTKYPGLFIANFLIYRNADDVLLEAIPVYVEITANLAIGNNNAADPITIAEVRLELRDTCPEANILLDELEFTDAEIIHCIRKSVDEFNAIPPLICRYNTDNFPFRSQWLKATVGHLLQIAARQYSRNNLKYSAGGTSINDKDKAQEYLVIAKELLDEWKNWAQNAKIAMNINLGFGCFGSGYY